jgi:hypothetical protein
MNADDDGIKIITTTTSTSSTVSFIFVASETPLLDTVVLDAVLVGVLHVRDTIDDRALMIESKVFST